MASGTAASTWAIRSSRSLASRAASSSRRLAMTSAATANARMAGASSVPERTSLSWPPPCSTGTGWTPRASSSAPAPTGPPNLCPVMVIASAPLAAKLTGSWPAACTASVWNGMPCSRASAASSGIGCTTPTSLFAHITVTRATPPGSAAMASASAAGGSTPVSSTGSQCSSASSWPASQCTESSTA